MAEYISMSDLEIIYCRKGCAECKNEMCLDEMLRGLPTIDIVHCSECVWFNEGYTKCKMGNINGGNKTYFCADGGRKDDGD